MVKHLGIIVTGAFLTACGGGGGGVSDTGKASPDAIERLGSVDAFWRAAKGTYGTYGLTLSHVGSTDHVTHSTGCSELEPATEDEIAGWTQYVTEVTPARVCLSDGGVTVCEYPQDDALRSHVSDGASSEDEITVLPAGGTVTLTLDVAGNDTSYELMAGSSAIGCTTEPPPPPQITAADIGGTWTVTGHEIDSNGTPARTLTGTLACTPTACTGVVTANLAFDATTGAWSGTSNDATTVSAVVSPDTRILAMLVCPAGTPPASVTTACMIVSGTH